MQHIGISLKKFLQTSGLEKGVLQQNALDLWPNVVGENISKNTSPEKIEHGIMIVRAETPAWRQELQFQKKNIITNLNKKLNKKVIKDIRFI